MTILSHTNENSDVCRESTVRRKLHENNTVKDLPNNIKMVNATHIHFLFLFFDKVIIQ